MRLGDLDALKEQIKNDYCKNHCPLPDAEYYCPTNCSVRYFIKIIDNAPTVDVNSIIDGLNNEIDDLSENLAWYINERNRLLKERRPQGEWARHDEWVGGEYVGGFYHVGCPCIDLETAYYSKWRTHFCPNCGVSMKGGAE